MVKRSLFYLTMMKWVTQGKRKSAALDLSQDKCRLSCFHSGRQENTTHACQVPGPSQSPWSGSSKTPEPMAVAGGQFWRLSSFEDHPLSTSGGQSFKHPLFAFLERKRLFWLSKALLLFSVGWGYTISTSNLWFIHQDSCPSPCENAWSEDLFLPLNSFMLIKHLEENSQQCNCLTDYWLSILISPPLSPPLWLLLLIPEATDASSPLPSLDSGPEDLLSRHRIPPRLVFKSSTSYMFPDRQIHSTDKQWHSNPEGTRKCRSLLALTFTISYMLKEIWWKHQLVSSIWQQWTSGSRNISLNTANLTCSSYCRQSLISHLSCWMQGEQNVTVLCCLHKHLTLS